MAGRRKTIYRGFGSHIQIPVSDEEHMAFSQEADDLNLPITEYGRRIIQARGKHLSHVDQVRPENIKAHRRLETLLNQLEDGERDRLMRMLEAALPATRVIDVAPTPPAAKSKQAS